MSDGGHGSDGGNGGGDGDGHGDGHGSGHGSGDTDGWDAAAGPISGSSPRMADPVPHSRLVGLMAEPVSRSVPLRRSTVLMLVAFLGFGTLSYLYPPNGSTTAPPAVSGGIPGTFIPIVPTPVTHPATTTTTSPHGGADTTTTTTTSTTTRPNPITTTTTNTAPIGPTSTTTSSGPTSTTSTSTSTTTTAP